MRTEKVLTKEYWKITKLFQDQMNQWQRETGDCPRSISLRSQLFDRLCAEVAGAAIASDKSNLEMIQSFKIAGPTGYIIIERHLEGK